MMILREYLTLWLRAQTPILASSTAEGYRAALAHLSEALLGRELEQLNAMEIEGEINALAATAPRQAQILHVVLSRALWQAQKKELIRLSPMRLVEKPKHRKKEIFFLSADEVAAYVRALEGNPCRSTLLMMLLLGLRRNEARAIRPEDVRDGVLMIRRQRRGQELLPLKTASSRRDIPIPDALRSIFEGPEGEYLCPCSEKALRRAHLRAMKRAGIEKPVTLHGLRHTCATLAVNSGADIGAVSLLLGHAHISTTMDIYVHPDLAPVLGIITNSCVRFRIAS